MGMLNEEQWLCYFLKCTLSWKLFHIYFMLSPPAFSKTTQLIFHMFPEFHIYGWNPEMATDASVVPQLGSGGAGSIFITVQLLPNCTVSFDFIWIKAVHLIQSFLINAKGGKQVVFYFPKSQEVYLSGYCGLGVKTKHLELIKKKKKNERQLVFWQKYQSKCAGYSRFSQAHKRNVCTTVYYAEGDIQFKSSTT